MKLVTGLLLGAFIVSISACGSAFSGIEILPDENLTVEGEEAPLNQASPNLAVLGQMREPKYTPAEAERILASYGHLDAGRKVPVGLLKRAVLFYHANRELIPNKAYISVVDFAAHSSRRRFFVVEMSTGAVWALHTAHGTGSDQNNNGLLEGFSNRNGSLATSRGYILTAEIYYGKYGRSLRLDGISPANSNMRERAVVIHGSDYVQDREVQQGRSWGCLAIAMSLKDELIDRVARGSLIYAGLSPEHWSADR